MLNFLQHISYKMSRKSLNPFCNRQIPYTFRMNISTDQFSSFATIAFALFKQIVLILFLSTFHFLQIGHQLLPGINHEEVTYCISIVNLQQLSSQKTHKFDE